MLERLAHVGIGYANNMSGMLRFYRELFGLVEVARTGQLVFLSGGRKWGYDVVLGPWPAGLRHFSFQILSADQLEPLRRSINSKGIKTETIDPTDDFEVQAGIRFAMPSGHLMEIIVVTPGRVWDAIPLVPRDNFTGGGPLCIEHISIDCDNVQELVRFCVDDLGFRISEYSRMSDGKWFLAFLHCQSQHHDLGVFTPSSGWSGPALNHFAFVVPSVNELVRVADAARNAGFVLECSPGRHILGDNIFIYVRDPSGNRVEIATPLSRVDFNTPAREYAAGAHQEWSNFDAWRPGVPPVSRKSLPCFDARGLR